MLRWQSEIFRRNFTCQFLERNFTGQFLECIYSPVLKINPFSSQDDFRCKSSHYLKTYLKTRPSQITKLANFFKKPGVLKDNLQNHLDVIPGKPNKYQVLFAAIRRTVSFLYTLACNPMFEVPRCRSPHLYVTNVECRRRGRIHDTLFFLRYFLY